MRYTSVNMTEMLRAQKARVRRLALFLCLALLVSLATNAVFASRGEAMTRQDRRLSCALEQHRHTDSCYSQEGVLICGYADFVVHSHNADCFDENGALVCPLEQIEAHRHFPGCYEESANLICPLEESEGHLHDLGCYDETGALVCGLEEGEGAHIHSADCCEVRRTLICGKSEIELHTHTDSCFDETGALICGRLQVLEHSHGEGCFITAETDEADEPAPAVLSFTGEANGVLVSVEADEGAFPAGTTMAVTAVEDAQVLDAAAVAVEAPVLRMQAVDICFFDAEGSEIEPLLPIRVSMRSALIAETEEPVVVHVADSGETQVMSQSGETDGESVLFDSDSFSVYVIVETVLETSVITADGETWRVSVSFSDKAGLPEDAALAVREIPADSEAYAEALEETVRALSDENGVAGIGQARFFDISILRDGQPVEPAAPVYVRMEYVEPVPLVDNAALQVVHFAESGTEILSPAVSEDSASITGLGFAASSFSTFAFVQADYIGSLNGQSFALVRDNGANKAAVLSSPHPSVANRMDGVWVNELEEGVLTAVTTSNGTVEADKEISAWTFEHVRDNCYYIRSDDGLYLTIDGAKLTTGAEPCLLEVMPLSNKNYYTGKVHIRSAENSNYRLNLKGGNVSNGFQGSTATDANSTFSLYAADTLSTYPSTIARKLSAAEIQAAQELIIYRQVWNQELGKNEYYVIDGSGKLIYAFDEGDTVGYRSSVSATWYVIEHIDENTGLPSGYYDFFNAATGKYLAPQSGGILSDSPVGILLSGKSGGRDCSTIEAWDGTTWSYCGLQLDTENRVALPGLGADSAEFCFALPFPAADEFHEVATVDSSSLGVSIKMFDFPNRLMMNLFNDNVFYEKGGYKQGLLQSTLGEDGLPVTATGRSFSEIYNSENFKGEGNHLFLASSYGISGYYEYNSFNNFAHYDPSTGNFTVYDEQGTPSNSTNSTTNSFLRGNYMPYNNIDPQRKSTNTKLYDNRTDWTSLEDPQFDGTLYLTDTPDYYFGTIVEASFVQAKGGRDASGVPIIYEFDGDDDLWVFLDGVLVLDIGGIHSAVHGSIDFSTGVVRIDGSPAFSTTIKQCFRNAGRFPDGTPWNDALVDNYFTGETFNDYSGHTMKMFYQERGAGASTLNVRFNLPVVDSGTFAVEKQLGGTEQQKYANVQFAYQAFMDVDGSPVPVYPGIILGSDGRPVSEAMASEAQKEHRVAISYEGSGSSVDFYDGVEINGSTYDHVFYLKPDETAVFAGIPEGVKYYVQEIDVSGAFFETVMINEASLGEDSGLTEDSSITAISSSKTIQERQRVLFTNQCSPRNIRDLRITKQVENPIDDQAGFEFRIWLEGADGSLTYYSRGDYCLTKTVDGAEHYFKFVDGALADQGTEPVVCSQSGEYGTVAGVPDGYTVVIKGLLAGTDFYVEEIRNPEGYLQVSKTVAEGSCDAADLPTADGRIALGKDAQVTITNRRYSVIAAEKSWESGSLVSKHGLIRLALFEKSAEGESLLLKGEVLQSDNVQDVAWPATRAVWHLELPEGKTLADYVVREVLVSGETVTAIPGGGSLTVNGETMSDNREADNRYQVSYAPGQETALSESPVILSREDSVINARLQAVSFVKVDVADPDSTFLGGAVFDLYPVVEGVRADAPLYSGLTSRGEDGLVLLGGESLFYLPVGSYHLVETQAPRGYQMKAEPVLISVAPSDVNYNEGTAISGSGIGKSVADDVYTLKISNNAGVVLPSTGGMGLGLFTIAGLLLMSLSLAVLLVRVRKSAR